MAIKRWVCKELPNNGGAELIPAEQYGERPVQTHAVIADSMDATFNHVDCKVYDSKSRLRKNNRAAGMIELGNDKPKMQKAKLDEKGISHDVREYMRHF